MIQAPFASQSHINANHLRMADADDLRCYRAKSPVLPEGGRRYLAEELRKVSQSIGAVSSFLSID